jgi:hypothetical protein
MTPEMQISDNSYQALLSIHNLALLNDWLVETKELLVDIDLSHSGGSGKIYIIKSLPELHKLLAEQTWPEIHVTIFREKQYPLRGSVDEKLITQALEAMKNWQSYAIVRIGEYPTPCEWLDDGKSYEQLRAQLEQNMGEYVGIGANPFEAVDFRARDSYTKVFSLIVSKNQNYYEPYAKAPEQYAHIVQEWSDAG